MSASPAAVIALAAMNYEIDIRHILPAIRVPTLLLHSVRDATIPIGASRYMAERFPGARLVELPGEDHLPWLTDADTILGEIEEFVTGVRHAVEPDRVLATVLFTDIVGATEKAAALGDLRDVESQPRSPEAGVAYRVSGVTQWFAGDFIKARSHLEQALAILDPERDRDLAFRPPPRRGPRCPRACARRLLADAGNAGDCRGAERCCWLIEAGAHVKHE